MSGSRRALIVANDTYDHASFAQLRAPAADAEALADVLGDPDIGGFTVAVVHNEPSYEVQTRIEDVFADSRPDDLLLLHFSGHGVKSDTGELFVAARNTRPDRLASTAVSADFIQRCMKTSRARSIVLFLDCCYGGAFGQGVAVRAAGPVNVMESFPAGRLGGGRGRAVISASSAMEYAFEGTALAADERAKPSVFTSAVVEGLRTGEADRDEDGLVSLDELYDYVFDRVRAENPKQTPGRDVEMTGDLYLARSRRRRLRPQPIPEAIAAALREANPTFRRGAISELRDRLWHEDPAAALGALEALRQVVGTDTKSVADDAEAAIGSATMSVVPSSVDFGAVAVGTGPQSTTVEIQGPALARAVTVQAEAPLEAAVEEDGRVRVTLMRVGEPFEGQVTITSPVGSVVLPIKASVSETRAPDEPALVERRVTPSAAQSAASLPIEPEPPAGDREAMPLLSSGIRRNLAVVSALGGLLIIASYAAEWTNGNRFYVMAPGLVTGLFVLGVAGILVGIALAVDVAGRVAAGLLLGIALIAGNGALTALGIMTDNLVTDLRAGWFLAAGGELLIVAAGVICLVSVLRSGTVRAQWPARLGNARLVVIGLVLAGSLAQIAYATVVATYDDNSVYSAITMMWVVSYLVAGAVVLTVSPSILAHAFLIGWATTALGQPLSDLRYLNYIESNVDSAISSWEPLMAVQAAVLIALIFVTAFMNRQGDQPAG